MENEDEAAAKGYCEHIIEIHEGGISLPVIPLK